MKRNIQRRYCIAAIVKYFSLALFLVASAEADTFHMQSGRLWYSSDGDVNLETFLDNFATLGVQVARDPTIGKRIEGECNGEPLEECLDRLLGGLGYVIRWDVIKGPVDKILRLNAIEIYKPGHKEDVEPYQQNMDHEISSYNGRDFVANEILLGFRSGATRADVERLLRQLGGTITDCVEPLGVYRVRFPPGANVVAIVEQVSKQGMVATAEPNYVSRLPDREYSNISLGEPKYNKLDLADDQKAYLAILDSGLNSEKMPKGLIAGDFNALQPGRDIEDPAGHGTHMAMIASGLVEPNGIEHNAAEGTPLLAVRTFDDNGYTSNYDLMRAIEYSLDNGARVINLSWGSEHSSQFISTAINFAQSKDAIIVAAAGNEPTGRKVYPAAYPGVLAMAAADETGKIWDKSNYGDFVSASAPGMATLPVTAGDDKASYGGTSIASAYAAGVIARYVANNPDSSPAEVVLNFEKSLSPSNNAQNTGKGLLNAEAVVRFLDGKQ